MASASKTPNLNLPQWVETEKPERTDFNTAFDAIDDVIDGGSATPFAAMPYVGTAPIIESGSNTDGHWVKFADGTLIQWGKIIYTGSVSNTALSAGGGYRTSAPGRTFPTAFYDTNYTLFANNLSTTVSIGTYASVGTETAFSLGFYTVSSDGTSRERHAVWMAIGRWKA